MRKRKQNGAKADEIYFVSRLNESKLFFFQLDYRNQTKRKNITYFVISKRKNLFRNVFKYITLRHSYFLLQFLYLIKRNVFDMSFCFNDFTKFFRECC